VDAAARRMRVATAFGEFSALLDERLRQGERCIVCVRPENAVVDGAPAAERNVVSGRITFAAYLGNTLRYDVDLGQGVLFKTDVGDPWHHEQLPMDSAVRVSFPVTSTVAIPAE
jgi:hypothetical protein